ncbi:MAG: putative ATP-grasp superfamily ATP-dependent carboligase [Candidatus Azotimanducaceae bacterium]|jgi:predicted ATP-grasp superfamily ATP-dependent carboligase
MQSKHNILILDATQRSALAATRSLGQNHGLSIYTAGESSTSLAGSSCYSQHYTRYPSPKNNPSEFCDWLCSFTKNEGISIVYPMTEITSQLVLMCKDRLDGCDIPFGEYEQVLSVANKASLVSLARELNIPIPSTIYCEDGTKFDYSQIASYPIVLKPALSHIWLKDRWLSTSVHIARDKNEVEQLLEKKEYLREHPFLLQEFIPGHGEGIFTLYNSGEALTFFAHERLREKPPRGGVSVLSQSRACDPDQLNYAKSLLDHTNWHGVAMVEFRVTPEGKPYLMEVNTRFWGSLQLSIDSGVDFPNLLHKITIGETVEEIKDYIIGQKLRWVLGDIDSFYLVIRDSGFSIREKLQRLLSFLTPHPLTTRHEVNRWGDLGPAWFELKQYVKALFGRD